MDAKVDDKGTVESLNVEDKKASEAADSEKFCGSAKMHKLFFSCQDYRCKKEGDKDTVLLPVPVCLLTGWNIAMFCFQTAFVCITLVAGNLELRVPLYVSAVGLKIGSNPNNTEGWALEPKPEHNDTWLYLTWVTASFFMLSALAHLGNAAIWRPYYLDALARGYSPFRWIEYSFSASVMVMILAYTSGTLDLGMHIALFGLTFVTMTFGHLQ